MNALAAAVWSERDAPAAARALAIAAGLAVDARKSELCNTVEAQAEQLGLDLLPARFSYTDATDAVSSLAPALIRIVMPPGEPGDAPRQGHLAVLRSSRRTTLLLTPTHKQLRVPTQSIVQRLVEPLVAEPAALIETWLEQAEVRQRKRPHARRALLKMLAGEHNVDGIWLLRHDPGARFWRVLSAQGLPAHAAAFALAALVEVACTTCGWWLLGSMALDNAARPGSLWAWSLLLFTAVPFRVLGTWASGRLSVIFASALKQRTLCGALRLDPNAIRGRGSGGLLAMASECEAIERAGLDGTLGAFLAVTQLLGAVAILAAGAGGVWHAGLLVAAFTALAFHAARTFQRLSSWTSERFGLSSRFVELLQGQRTRLVQGNSASWHDQDDAALARYADASRANDGSLGVLATLPARGWLVVGLCGLLPAIVYGAAPEAVAISTLGIIQAQNAFAALAQGIGALLTASVAWQSVKPLFRAAAARPQAAALELPAPSAGSAASTIELSGLSFRYGTAGRYALRNCSATIRAGERWLLEGHSGSGKSTLANLITAVYRPTSGFILLDGLDRATLGDSGWHARVASAPQFHENYLLAAPLSFNLLMGRGWPPEPADLEAARDVCQALGLGPLLRRMPSGIHQLVGETGWQLSHGERSRVFLARALLQRASALVLDESFGALDPETLESCMSEVRKRAPTLVVIAHP
ncbi:MAG: ATP-binding cassette domain-containing protein [Myxococcota bacterium]